MSEPRCESCPLGAHGPYGYGYGHDAVACPAHWDWPGYCGHARAEARRHPRAPRPWSARIVARATEGPARPDGPRRALPGELVLRGHGNSTGYGRMASYLAKALDALGVAVAFDSIEGALPSLDPFCAARLVAPGSASPTVQMSSPWAVERPGACLYSMYEASDLPEASVAKYNTARVVVVPCEWNRRVFADSGVTAPIRVVPLGVDAGTYRPDGPGGPDGFTVLTVAGLRGGGHRKRVDDLVAAFVEALGDREDARLVLKIHAEDQFPEPAHPRVTLDRSDYPDAGMVDLYRRCSAYASLSRGEGWGLPILEAMACGLPYVGPIHSGIADFATPDCGYPVAWTAAPASGPWYDEAGRGEWYPSDHGSAVLALRRAYADRDGRRARGEAAARRAAEFSWDRSARELLAVLREFGMVPGGAAPAPARKLRPVAEVRAAQLRVKSCPHRTPPACGCSGADGQCSKGHGRNGLVSQPECEACPDLIAITRGSGTPTPPAP